MTTPEPGFHSGLFSCLGLVLESAIFVEVRPFESEYPPRGATPHELSKPRKSNKSLQVQRKYRMRALIKKSWRIFSRLYTNFRTQNDKKWFRTPNLSKILVFEPRRFSRFWIYHYNRSRTEGREGPDQKKRKSEKFRPPTFQNFWPNWNRVIFRWKRCSWVASQKPPFCQKTSEITYFWDL